MKMFSRYLSHSSSITKVKDFLKKKEYWYRYWCWAPLHFNQNKCLEIFDLRLYVLQIHNRNPIKFSSIHVQDFIRKCFKNVSKLSSLAMLDYPKFTCCPASGRTLHQRLLKYQKTHNILGGSDQYFLHF